MLLYDKLLSTNDGMTATTTCNDTAAFLPSSLIVTTATALRKPHHSHARRHAKQRREQATSHGK
jgi:hypothetical protein